MKRIKFVLVAMFAWLALAPGTAEAQNCGGDGQRACCLGEAALFDQTFGACRDGITEVNSCPVEGIADCLCQGKDGKPTLLGTSSNSHCKKATSCGGAGQRACCIGEDSGSFGQCKSGNVEIPGCSGDDCFCGSDANPYSVKSSGTCVPVSACGGMGQRACTSNEREGNSRPCDYYTEPGFTNQKDLVLVDRCVGDCRGKEIGSAFSISTGMCAVPGTHLFPTSIPEPTTNRTVPPHDAATVPSPVCPLYGYMDMHLHLFADLAHGGGVLAGKAYDPEGGVNVALQNCAATYKDLVQKDGTDLLGPGIPCDRLRDWGFVTSCDDSKDDNKIRIFHGGHDIFNDGLGFGTRDGALKGLLSENSNLGSPLFNGWPRWTTTTHQQAYYKWLERAWQGGLRLTTMLAVTNETLCRTSKHERYALDKDGKPRVDANGEKIDINCEDSMGSIDQQIQAAKDFETFIDLKDNIPDNGWFKIVYTPKEARDAIARGRLAVVLGIETAELFNCKFPVNKCTTRQDGWITSCPGDFDKTVEGRLTVPVTVTDPSGIETELTTCSEALIKDRINHYESLGVRHIFPIHNFDNAFGGAATWQDAIEVGNRVAEDHWWFTGACPTVDGNYGFALGQDMQAWLTLLQLHDKITLTPGGRDPDNDPPSCNKYGLFGLGQTLITELMNKGMLIDVDHMSRKAFDKTLEMAETRTHPTGYNGYPGIVASHVISFDNYEEAQRHERMRTKSQLERIKGVGGMIAAMLKDDTLDSDKREQGKFQLDYPQSNVKNDCRHSSKSFAQAFEYAVDVMGGPVAMGSDFNGTAGHFGPRFGSDACGGDTNEQSEQYRSSKLLPYPFTLPEFGSFDRQVTGQRTFDYNFDGLAHIGLLPDFVADLRNVGLRESDLNMLFRSAEAYIKVWEGARLVGFGEQPDTSTPSCVTVTGHYPGTVNDGDMVILTAGFTPPGATITWDLGDGNQAHGPTVFHVYENETQVTKQVQVKVRAQDPSTGSVAEHSGKIDVGTSNNTLLGAQIKINAPAQTYEGDQVSITFDHASALWTNSSASCGDGGVQQDFKVTETFGARTQGSMKCTYPAGLPPSVSISVTVHPRPVVNPFGEVFTYSRPIQILNRPPEIVAPTSVSVGSGTTAALQLDLKDAPGEKLRLVVDWGERFGTGTDYLELTDLPPGPLVVSHIYAKPSNVSDPYHVVIRLLDEAAEVDALLTVDIVGVPPTLSVQGPAQVSPGGLATFRFSGQDDGAVTMLTLLSCGTGTLERGDILPVSPVQYGTSYTFDCRFTAPNPANPVRVAYTDAEGRKTEKTWLVTVADTTPPLVAVPAPITREAASAQGAAVGFSASATDDVDGLRPVTCIPASNSVFAIGTTTVACSAIDKAGNTGSASFNITVVDTTAPTILLAVSPQANAAGWYKDPVSIVWTVTDLVGVTSAPGCGPVSLVNDTPATVVTCTASDAAGNTSTKSVTVKLDVTPPTVTCSNSAPLLWPPNHGLVNIQTTVGVDDGVSKPAGFTLVRVTSSEPDTGLGGGDTAGDIQGFVPGTADTGGQLRAERAGNGPGRVYSLVYEGSDLAGNRSTCTTIVTVPKSQGSK